MQGMYFLARETIYTPKRKKMGRPRRTCTVVKRFCNPYMLSHKCPYHPSNHTRQFAYHMFHGPVRTLIVPFCMHAMPLYTCLAQLLSHKTGREYPAKKLLEQQQITDLAHSTFCSSAPLHRCFHLPAKQSSRKRGSKASGVETILSFAHGQNRHKNFRTKTEASLKCYS